MPSTDAERDKQNLIAQWAFDTSSILGRFHLWLEDVEVEEERHREPGTRFSFLPARMESLVAMTAAKRNSTNALIVEQERLRSPHLHRLHDPTNTSRVSSSKG